MVHGQSLYKYCLIWAFSRSQHLFKRQLSSQLRPQHHHPRNPEEDEVTASLQDGIWVEALKVSGLREMRL